jgi:hypothetical protein
MAERRVLPRIGHVLPRSPSSVSLVGHSLPERLRSASIGLLCIVAAVGLGLVALVSNRMPDFLTGVPVLGPPHEHVGDARVISRPRAANAAPVASEGVRAGRPAGTSQAVPSVGRGPAPTVAPPVSSPHQQQPAMVAHGSPSPGVKPVSEQPGAGAPSTGAPSTDQPTVTATPPPAPVASPPAEEPAATPSPGHGNGKAKGHEKSNGESAESTPSPSTSAVSEEAGEDGDSDSDSGQGNGYGHAYDHGHSYGYGHAYGHYK